MSDDKTSYDFIEDLEDTWDLSTTETDSAPPSDDDPPSGGPRRRKPFFSRVPVWLLVFGLMGTIALERVSMLMVVSDAPMFVVMAGGAVFLTIVLTVLFVGGTLFYRYSER